MSWTEDEDDDGGPFRALVGVDANALDPHPKRDQAISQFKTLVETGQLTMFIGEGVAAELSRAGRSFVADRLAKSQSVPKNRPLSAAQHIARIRVRAILYGNARPDKHAADARHVSEAAEAGCAYFITYDSRILHKRADLEALAVPDMKIVTLEDFLTIRDRVSGQAEGRGEA